MESEMVVLCKDGAIEHGNFPITIKFVDGSIKDIDGFDGLQVFLEDQVNCFGSLIELISKSDEGWIKDVCNFLEEKKRIIDGLKVIPNIPKDISYNRECCCILCGNGDDYAVIDLLPSEYFSKYRRTGRGVRLSDLKGYNINRIGSVFEVSCFIALHYDVTISQDAFMRAIQVAFRLSNSGGRMRVYREYINMERKIRSYEDSMNKVKDFYMNAISTQAPVEYWNRRRKEANETAQKASRLFRWWSIALGSVLMLTFLGLLIGFSSSPDTMKALRENVPLPLYALPSLALVLCLWWIRLQARLMLRKEDEADDAAERVAITQCFLALQADNQVKAEERLIALNALFRSRTASADDSHSPHVMLEAIYKTLSSK